MPLDDIQSTEPEIDAAHSVTACRRTQRDKFTDPDVTAKGEPRARVEFTGYESVWFNTGTLCNIMCRGCYIESSPKNDRLVYLARGEVKAFLDETTGLADRPAEIGFTGGEPFINPDVLGMLEDALAGGFHVLVLTNAMKPMQRHRQELLRLQRHYPGRMRLRVSLDHFERVGHEQMRGPRTWQPAMDGLAWLSANGFDIAVAGRKVWSVDEAAMRSGYARLFAEHRLRIDAGDASLLVLFPEMDDDADVPEISEGCWRALGKNASELMCANSRMVVKHKGTGRPVVQACTLLPFGTQFEMGASLEEARKSVSLNHRHCARFYVLGKASCTA